MYSVFSPHEAPDALADTCVPDASSADTFAPDASAPDAFSADTFAPDAFAPDAFSADAFAPDAFSSAPRVVQISAGGSHSCARYSDGQVRCWGEGSRGELGDGASFRQLSAVAVDAPGVQFVDVQARFGAACGATRDGRVLCWGWNLFGRLGDGTTTNRSRPVEVLGLVGFRAVSVSLSQHACAYSGGAEVRCWGYNGQGQLGDGTLTDRLSAVPVTLAEPVRFLTEGGNHTFAVTQATNRLFGWGANNSGVLLGMAGSVPVPLALPPTVAELGAGNYHACVVHVGGAVQCWGSNGYGQLGIGTTASSSVPVTPTGLGVAQRIAAAQDHTCAIREGEVLCWGRNESGQLGDGSLTQRTIPTAVANPAGLRATEVAAGSQHSCALYEDGSVWCWGTAGALGDGTLTTSSVPRRVVGL